MHPGEILREDFLVPLEVTQHRLAVAIGVPPRRINEIVHGKRRISADTALRLSRFFGTTDRFWLNLQTRLDLETERDKIGLSWRGSGRCRRPEGRGASAAGPLFTTVVQIRVNRVAAPA